MKVENLSLFLYSLNDTEYQTTLSTKPR